MANLRHRHSFSIIRGSLLYLETKIVIVIEKITQKEHYERFKIYLSIVRESTGQISTNIGTQGWG